MTQPLFFIGKGLKNKAERTAEEDDIVRLLFEGKNMVDEEKLSPVLEWTKNNK